MDIQGVIAIARRVHDAERVNLGAASTRDQRNAFWARVIGIVHHGHPIYNLTPDPQWHLKDPDAVGSGRPQSDDVTVSMPSRLYWDCIPSAGADSYSIGTGGSGDVLPADQTVYPPPVPDGAGTPDTPPKPPQPLTPPVVLPDRGEMMQEGQFLHAYYISPWGLQRPQGLWIVGPDGIGHPDWEGIAAWLWDVYLKARVAGKSRAEARAAYITQIRQSAEWRTKHPGETS